jgi:hypothetical protein
MKEIIIGQVLQWAIPVILGALVVWLQGRSAREQRWAALGGQVAREAVMIAEGSGYKGAGKFELAISVFNKRMAAAGMTIDPDQVISQVQAAHTEMSLDKTTAYNEKPCTLDTADEAVGVKK